MSSKLEKLKKISEEKEVYCEDFIDEDFDDQDFDEPVEKINESFKKDEAEEIVLSIILRNGFVPDKVTEHTFTNFTYKEVFKGILHFSEQDSENKFDYKAVGVLLSKRRSNNKWSDDIIPSIINKTMDHEYKIENYLSILKEEQINSKAKMIAEQILLNINKGDISYLKKAANELNSIDAFEDQGYDTISDAIDTAMFELDEKINADSDLSGIKTGIPTLDDTIGGLQSSDLIILAARPGQGKTATAINFAYNSGASCGFISSEMPSAQLALRLLSLDSGVNAQKLRNPKKLNKEEIKLIKESSLRLKNDKEIYITDKPSISIQEVAEIAKKWKEMYDIKILFIDYLQRLTYKTPGSVNMPRHERVGMIALESKEIARDLDIAVVGLAQISRGSEKNESTGGQPMLSDLKDSGMLEQEADLVICPWRENTSGMDVNSETDMIILILKNRHGPLGEIPVIWVPRIMKIYEKVNYESESVNSNFYDEFNEEDFENEKEEIHF